MKECLSCHNKVEELQHTCPQCGGTSFLSSGQDALSALDAMKKQGEAKEHNDRGGQYFQQGRYKEAEAEFRKAIEANPFNATANGNLGNALYKQGQLEEAITWLEKALSINPRLGGVPEALAKYKAEAEEKLSASKKKMKSKVVKGLLKTTETKTVTGFVKVWISFLIVVNLGATCVPASRLTDSSLGGLVALVMLLSAVVAAGYFLLYYKKPVGLYMILITNFLGMLLNFIEIPSYSITITTGLIAGIITYFITRKQITYPFGRTMVIIILLASLGVFALFFTGNSLLNQPRSPEIEALVPDFTLPLFSDEGYSGTLQVKLSSLRGKVVIVNFWSSWAAPCKNEAPILESAWRRYQSSGEVVFLGINYVDTEAEALSFLSTYSVTYPVGADIRSEISGMFNISGVPETYVIDQKGVLRYTQIGPFQSLEALEEIIDQILDEK